METRRNKFNIKPSENENQILAQLLRDHDEQVSAFKAASDAMPILKRLMLFGFTSARSIPPWIRLRTKKFTNQPAPRYRHRRTTNSASAEPSSDAKGPLRRGFLLVHSVRCHNWGAFLRTDIRYQRADRLFLLSTRCRVLAEAVAR